MTIHLYCIRRAGDPVPPDGLTGVAEAGVETVEEGDLAAWISRVPSPAPAEEEMRAHDRVVRAALRTATPLPARFGGVASEDELREALRTRAAEFAAVLDRVAGHVEMALTLTWDEDAQRAEIAADLGVGEGDDGPPESGRDYLERKKREMTGEDMLRARAAAAADAVEAAASHLVAASERALVPRRGVAAAVAHLVRVERISDHRAVVTRAAEGLRGLHLAVGGPWAPYSFTRAVP